MYLFISHSSKEAAVASEICDVLEKNGNECFLAPRNIRSGHEYAEEIVDGIDRSGGMVVVLSKNANKSPHVLREIERAVSRSLPIIIYKLESVNLTKSMEYFLMTHQWMNAGADLDYTSLVECVKNLKQPPAEQPPKALPSDTPVGKGNQRKKLAACAAAAAAVVLICLAVFLPKKPGPEEVAPAAGSNNGTAITENDMRNEDKGANISAGVSVKVGDTVQFGSYNGQPVEWRVLKVSDDGKEGILISKSILTIKAFDAAESGKYNHDGESSYWAEDSQADTDMELQARVRGSSDWSTSNIRTWLNSEKEVVEYAGQEPAAAAMSELKNGYDNEPGFLNGFTDEERQTIREVSIETNGNALSGGGKIITNDRVYLLSRDELSWFDDAGLSKLAMPTDAAVEQDQIKWYQSYSLDMGLKDYYWWLREPVEESASRCYIVGNGYTKELIYDRTVGVEGFGVRPAVTVNLESDCIVPKQS